MWGFNSGYQTTVVITRGAQAYLLYANKLTKELSPDSTFGKGKTIHENIKNLEYKSIPEVDEEINGKEGLKVKIKEIELDWEAILLKIKETEMDLSELRQNSKKNKKKIGYTQERLSNLYSRRGQIGKNLKQKRSELRVEEERLHRFRFRLEELKGYLGDFQVSYTRFGFVYTFTDGCTFNTYTQDFKVPDSLDLEDIGVRVITIGPDATSETVDEIQLQAGITTGKPEDKQPHEFAAELNDVFKSDQYKLKKFDLGDQDRYEVAKLLKLMADNEWELKLHLVGGGVGVLLDGNVVESNVKELDKYPGDTKEDRLASKNSEAFSPLRKTSLLFEPKELAVHLSVSSYTDPVKSNFSKKNIDVQPILEKHSGWTENQVLSGFRTFYIAEEFIGELLHATHLHFEPEEREEMLTYLKKTLERSTVKIKAEQLSYKEYAAVAHKEVSFYDRMIGLFEAKDAMDQAILEM